MPAKRSAMRKIKEILRLKFEAKFSHERIAAATGCFQRRGQQLRSTRGAEGPELAATG